MSKYIRVQKTRELKTKKDSSHTENSAYWADVHKYSENNGEGWREHPQANPDLLPESNNTSPSSPQLIYGEAVEHLQGRQREVYLLVMREAKSLSEVGEVLDISKSSAQVYLDRANKFITAYCRVAIENRRV